MALNKSLTDPDEDRISEGWLSPAFARQLGRRFGAPPRR
tara:strand:- start:376 stop:492 length:117 start_codon:yes stop_codon:yes gene_type:complete